MKIAVIGAGFTGLSAAYELAKKGHKVTIFEKEKYPGGLAVGFKDKNWLWTMEKHYHHFFTNDSEVLNLAKELNHKVIIKKPKTSIFVEDKIYQLDSFLKLITFNKLTLIQKIRMAFALSIFRYNPFWKMFEGIKITEFLPKIMGNKPYEMIWKPQLLGKFGNFSNDISLAWFWARIKKRTTKLAYPEGGFLELANELSKKIKGMNGNVFLNTEVTEIKTEGKKISITCSNKLPAFYFDKVIVTLPSHLFLKIVKDLPSWYRQKARKIRNLGAINLVLKLNKPFLKDNTYWLSICDKSSPLIAIVEHTNFMDKNYYNNEHLLYVGNYLPSNHPYMKMTANELLKIYTPYLKRINPDFELCILNFELFKDPFAQPIIGIDYHKNILPFETPTEGLYLANIEQVYPWDRGTNYAVELGSKIADIIE